MASAQRSIPDRVRTIDAVAMAAYAGATWDWTQTHLDVAAAQAAGFERPIVDGQMLGALLAAHAQDAIGAGARVTELAFRHAGPVLRDDRVRIRGVVVSDDGATVVLEQDVHVVDDTGNELGHAIIAARTTVVVEG